MLGNSAANILDGRLGADVMRGRGGNDTYYVDNAGDQAIENAGEGTDAVVSTVSFNLCDHVENLTLTGDAIRGRGNRSDNLITGNELGNHLLGGIGDDVLIGGGGHDQLDGGPGADRMEGGADGDRYLVDHANDVVVETADGGTDSITATIGFALPANVENLHIENHDSVHAIGNELDNEIVVLSSGDNVVVGGPGADLMRAFFGSDSYYVDNPGDRVVEQVNSPGVDSVYSSITYHLPGSMENLFLMGTASINATGNLAGNVLRGNLGDNVLDGRSGIDDMAGGDGSDTYFVDNVGDLVAEASGEGTDTVRSSISYTLPENVEELVLVGTDAIDGRGNDLDNRLLGNSAANVIVGRAGDDNIRGAGGADDVRGDTGADVFAFDDGDFAGLTPSTSDRIIDFTQAEDDVIDLFEVDANENVADDQSFTFIGTSAFHNVAGELRYQQSGGNTYATGDTDGDGIADFMIRLDGLHALVEGDFVI